MKGDQITINGDRWTVVDVAPAAPLAEMVAAILEEEGFVVKVRGADGSLDSFTMGAASLGTTYVLVPEAQAEAALALIDETVTDYQGDELELLMQELAGDGVLAGGEFDEDDDGDEDDDDGGNGDERNGAGGSLIR